MEYSISHDSMGTHVDWRHDGVTARMIDWFWSNMEKGFILWHPEQHEALQWAVPPKHGNPIGSIHIAPQTWSDGRRQNLYIRFERLEDVAPEIRDYIVYEHVVVVAGLGLGAECLANPDPMGERHWNPKEGNGAGRQGLGRACHAGNRQLGGISAPTLFTVSSRDRYRPQSLCRSVGGRT